MPAKWLKDAVFYEIYPQSFKDTNADGIGDLQGIIEKLDYVKSLGCNALWINPCFDSPFRDAGYDVRDYKKVAERYGTNEDLCRLFAEAHARGIHVLLDLVPGHTSEEHPWFRQSQSEDQPNEYSNRYIWTDQWFAGCDLNFIAGEAERPNAYIVNFFKCQPALNYGFLKPRAPWQLPMDHPDCVATREAMKDVMRFWLDRGCDGFRVDMAASLVKHDDEQKSGTCAIWRDVRKMLDADYPEAALVAEWSRPDLSLPAGFDMDFILNDPHTHYASLLRDYNAPVDNTYFRKDAPDRDARRFLDIYVPWYEATRGVGYISLPTCNHDTPRPRWHLDETELKLAYAFLFTMPGVPFLYYGDEIGMRYQILRTKEGGFQRTGTRTPMQWDNTKNLGFSEADAAALYLPVDPAADAPTVAGQEQDPDSLLNFVRSVLALRHREADLQADAPFELLSADPEKPLLYRRGGLLAALNPSDKALACPAPVGDREPIFTFGSAAPAANALELGPQSFVVLK